MLRTVSRALAWSVPLVAVSCGNLPVRWSQDWTAVSDERLFRTVQVGNWGSGVVLEHTGRRMLVLTCAHLVAAEQMVAVHAVDRQARVYRTLRARVVHRSHPHKEDLALLVIDDPPPPTDPCRVAFAEPFQPGEERDAAIMNVAIGADQPFAWAGKVFQQTQQVASFRPDAAGQQEWQLSKGILHGGITQANSGSPVFIGERLVGLAESSPGFGTRHGKLTTGVQISMPRPAQAFVREALRRLDRRPPPDGGGR